MNDQKHAAEVASTEGAPAPGVGAPSRSLRRGVLGAQIIGLLAILMAGFALFRAQRALWEARREVRRVMQAHNALVRKLNERFSGAGAALEAAGVPGGRAVVEGLKVLDKAFPATGRDRIRRQRLKQEAEAEDAEPSARRRR